MWYLCEVGRLSDFCPLCELASFTPPPPLSLARKARKILNAPQHLIKAGKASINVGIKAGAR